LNTKDLIEKNKKKNQLTLGYTKVFYLNKLVGKIKIKSGCLGCSKPYISNQKLINNFNSIE